MYDINVSIENFLDELSLPKDFYKNLLNEDDWSFIIKISALLEAVTTNLLVKKFKIDELEKALSFLDYANGNYGKIRLLYDMKVLNKEQYNILKKFAELRNSVVHNVSNVGFSFDSLIKESNKDQNNNFVNCYGYGIKDVSEFKNLKIKKKDFVTNNPKISIWITIGEIIGCLFLDKKLEEYKRKLTFTITPKEED